MRISIEAEYTLDQIQKEINNKTSGLMLTGGEPTVPKHFKETVMLLNELDYPLANIETNGYNLLELIKRVDTSKNIKFIYSPKIFEIGDLKETEELTPKLFNLSDKVYVKVVVGNESRLVETYLKYLDEYIIGDRKEWFDKVWLMPEGTNRADLLKNSEKVFDMCERYKFNFSSRDHVIYSFI
jgi:organic radical activating enzyme